eukprot:4154770-Ditylum_brightwellii.AAC.1
MDHPVEDRNNCGHFVPPNKMMAVIINNKINLDMLKKELPKLDKHWFETDFVKKNAAADSEGGGSKLFKGDKVHDVATCKNCKKPRPIYIMHTLKGKNHNLTPEQKKKRSDDLDLFKEEFVYGMHCPVKNFHVKLSIRCGEFVEN